MTHWSHWAISDSSYTLRSCESSVAPQKYKILYERCRFFAKNLIWPRCHRSCTQCSKKGVMNLMRTLLDKFRTLVTDNYYTSVSPADQRSTHLVGTLKIRRKSNAKDVIEKLWSWWSFAQESKMGVVFLKLKDKRGKLVLLTKRTVVTQ